MAGIGNLRRGIQNPGLTWIPLHWATYHLLTYHCSYTTHFGHETQWSKYLPFHPRHNRRPLLRQWHARGRNTLQEFVLCWRSLLEVLLCQTHSEGSRHHSCDERDGIQLSIGKWKIRVLFLKSTVQKKPLKFSLRIIFSLFCSETGSRGKKSITFITSRSFFMCFLKRSRKIKVLSVDFSFQKTEGCLSRRRTLRSKSPEHYLKKIYDYNENRSLIT